MRTGAVAALVLAQHAVLVSARAEANEDRTMAMVERAVQHEKVYGREQAFAAFNDRKGAFVDGEMYVFAFDLQGKCLAHGADPKLIGTNMLETKSADGKLMIKEMVELVRKSKNGWIDYMFKNPKSGAVELKTAYVQRVQDHFLGSGTYRAPPANR